MRKQLIEQPNKFRGKYRIESARLTDWDYSSEGAYFVTICTKNREHYFGEIVEGVMKYSQIGTKQIHIEGFTTFALQPRFYDHILRNEDDLIRVREYIANNPLKWDSDRNNPENIYM